jgi:hypothetical protein
LDHLFRVAIIGPIDHDERGDSHPPRESSMASDF